MPRKRPRAQTTVPDPDVQMPSPPNDSPVARRTPVQPRTSKRPRRARDEQLVPDVFRDMLREDSKRRRREGEDGSSAAAAPAAAVKVAPGRPGRRQQQEVDYKGKGKEVVADDIEDPTASALVGGAPPNDAHGGDDDHDDDHDGDGNGIDDDDDQDDSDDEEGGSSDDEDIDWEDVDLGAKPINTRDIMHAKDPPPQTGPLELVLDDPATRKAAADPRRRRITAVERRVRLETHKLHLICLLSHAHCRSGWCNNADVKAILKPLLPQRILDKLHHDPTDQQFRRSKFFLDGLREAVEAFSGRFRTTRRGLTAAHWQEPDALENWSPPPDTEVLARADFIESSKTLTGSRDIGAQLFCALLRSIGVATRLVCSLQVLPFSFASKSPLPPPPPAIQHRPPPTATPTASALPPPARKPPSLRRPLLRPPPLPAPRPKPAPVAAARPRPPESSHPVYWVEAWSVPAQRWITVDPLVTCSVARPQAVEPPSSDPLNTLTYAVAIEESGHAADVTRRYARFLTAKTRRARVGSTKGGSGWYRRLLRAFGRGFELDRDQLEQAEFARLMAEEPVPNNVQDLKDHPLFALKRHLRRDQVIWPERNVGTVSAGRGRTENIYRRQDVKPVKTREQWYKLGFAVAEAEVPRKFAVPRPRRTDHRGDDGRNDDDDDDDRDNDHGHDQRSSQPLFAREQATLYVPPPVVAGLVPKNRYGNLDVFVPTMVPPGGVHVEHPLAARAARLLGIDCSEAVTGFEFRNRRMNAVIRGAVVAGEYEAAVRVVVAGFEAEEEKERDRARAAAALALWRRWLLRLRIRARLGIGSDEPPPPGAGGGDVAHGVKGRKRTREIVCEDDREGEGEGEGEEEWGGGFVVDSEQEEEWGGGFVVDSEREEEGGGFAAELSDVETRGGFVRGGAGDEWVGEGRKRRKGKEAVSAYDGEDEWAGGFVVGSGGQEGSKPEAKISSGGFVLDGADGEGDGRPILVAVAEAAADEAEEAGGGGFLPDETCSSERGDDSLPDQTCTEGLPDEARTEQDGDRGGFMPDESPGGKGEEPVVENRADEAKEAEEAPVSPVAPAAKVKEASEAPAVTAKEAEEEEEVLSESSEEGELDWDLYGL